MLVLRVVMPCSGDMSIVKQDGGTIDLQPIFYGSESAGPHIQVIDVKGNREEIQGRYRIKVKPDGKLTLVRGDTAEERTPE